MVRPQLRTEQEPHFLGGDPLREDSTGLREAATGGLACPTRVKRWGEQRISEVTSSSNANIMKEVGGTSRRTKGQEQVQRLFLPPEPMGGAHSPLRAL